jgi:hypothetical protein
VPLKTQYVGDDAKDMLDEEGEGEVKSKK